MKLSAIIWDIDDVLVDTKSFQRRTQRTALNTLGIVEPSHVEAGINLWDRLLWYFHQDNYEGILEALVHEFELHVKTQDLLRAATLADQVWADAIPRIENCIELARDHGIVQGVVSNGDRTEQLQKLEQSGLIKYFDNNFIVTTTNRYHQKPNPYMLRVCCERLKVTANECAYVGDRSTDIIASNIAGLISIHIPRFAPESKEPAHLERIPLETPAYSFPDVLSLLEWLKVYTLQ